MRLRLPYLAAAALLYALAAYLYLPAPSFAFTYDESDYMWAGKRGFWANYTDEHGLSIDNFVRKGLELSRDKTKRGSFSQFIRASGDIGMYRHYHGPMYAYWLSFLHKLGVTSESGFRGAGLAIHFATATLILFGIWSVFPALHPLAGLIGCALFVFNRTALVAATTVITQHVLFAFLCVATLFAASIFFRAFTRRSFFVMMALLAASFCTVETASLLVVAISAAILLQYRRIRETWPGWRNQARLLAEGIGVFLLTVLVLWPKGILQVAIAKGFFTLAYISISRKTFTPLTPFGLWSAKFLASPWEISFLIVGAVAAFAVWRKAQYRAEMLPWLAFVATSFLVTLKITVEFTYYYAPLTAALTAVIGIACGEMWDRWKAPWRFLVPTAAALTTVAATVGFLPVMDDLRDSSTFHTGAVQYVRSQPDLAGKRFYVPYQLVPTLHYYFPQLAAEGFDLNYPQEQIAAGLASADVFLCEEQFCNTVEKALSLKADPPATVDPVGPSGQTLYAVRLRK